MHVGAPSALRLLFFSFFLLLSSPLRFLLTLSSLIVAAAVAAVGSATTQQGLDPRKINPDVLAVASPRYTARKEVCAAAAPLVCARAFAGPGWLRSFTCWLIHSLCTSAFAAAVAGEVMSRPAPDNANGKK